MTLNSYVWLETATILSVSQISQDPWVRSLFLLLCPLKQQSPHIFSFVLSLSQLPEWGTFFHENLCGIGTQLEGCNVQLAGFLHYVLHIYIYLADAFIRSDVPLRKEAIGNVHTHRATHCPKTYANFKAYVQYCHTDWNCYILNFFK